MNIEIKINWTLILLFVSSIIFGIIYYNNDYMTDKTRTCYVVDKLQSNGSYKHDGNFYLVLREERGIIFDVIVSPSTYATTNNGDTAYFKLRDMDIQQTFKDNFIYFFGQVVFGVISLVLLVVYIFSFFYKE